MLEVKDEYRRVSPTRESRVTVNETDEKPWLKMTSFIISNSVHR